MFDLFFPLNSTRSLLVFRPILPAGTRSAISIQSTIHSMKEKLLDLIESRNLLVESAPQLILDDLHNRESWFWSQDLQELEESGINESMRKFIDFDQKSRRIQEELELISIEKENYNSIVSSIIARLQDFTVEQEDSRLLQALEKLKEEKINVLKSWRII